MAIATIILQNDEKLPKIKKRGKFSIFSNLKRKSIN